MTTTATTPRTRRAGNLRNLAEGVAALAALLALLVLPPLGLALAVGNPVPEHTFVDGRITDAAVIGLLAGIVWLAWAQLVVVIAVEATAAIRGRGLPRVLPGCGLQQYLARRLVVAASVLLAGLGATATVAASAAPATAAVAACAPTVVASTPPAPVGEQGAVLPASTGVNPNDPTTSRHAVPQHPAEPGDGLWYVVAPPHGHHHDSLWAIAERHLGDGLRWREIYALNHHRRQADGQRVERPHLIQPGWRLLLPADATGIHAEHTTAPASRARAEKVASAPRTAPIPQARAAKAPMPPTITSPAPPTPPAQASPVPAAAPAHTTQAGASSVGDLLVAQSPEHTHDEDPAVPFGSLTLGLGAVAAAGLVAELTRRRRRAQRFRWPGQRLPKPTPEATAAERILRTANAELTVTVLRDALRDLAATCRGAGRSLPDVHAIRLNAATVTLLLGTDDPDPVAPFTATDARTWTATAEALAAEHDDDMADYTDPYPALVALGVLDDTVLLVNLEAAGTLTIVGDPAQTRPILHALILELGTSELTTAAELVLTDCPPRLVEMLDRGRATLLPAADAVRWASRRTAEVGNLVHSAGVPDVAAARIAEVADDAWAPAVLLHGGSSRQTGTGRGVSTVRLATERGDEDGWVLVCTADGWRLDPHGIDLLPQRLDPEAEAALGAALATAAAPAAEREPIPAIEVDPVAAPGVPHAHQSVGTTTPARRPLVVEPRSAAESAGTAVPTAPRVLVLGPVEILGVPDDGAPGRRRRATELVAYLALHPAATQHQLDEALWPGCRVSRNTRNPLVSRARQWIGSNPDGQPYLGLVADDGRYTLTEDVTCDWDDFQVLAARGTAAGERGLDDLEAALRLVRGRPFLGVNPAAYAWAEADAQDMISAIVDVAQVLGEQAHAAGDFRRVRWAAAQGLLAEPVAERLHFIAAEAAAAAGDQQEADRIISRLRRRIQDLDPEDDMDHGLVTGLLNQLAR
jgi:hypothetical protein